MSVSACTYLWILPSMSYKADKAVSFKCVCIWCAISMYWYMMLLYTVTRIIQTNMCTNIYTPIHMYRQKLIHKHTHTSFIHIRKRIYKFIRTQACIFTHIHKTIQQTYAFLPTSPATRTPKVTNNWKKLLIVPLFALLANSVSRMGATTDALPTPQPRNDNKKK